MEKILLEAAGGFCPQLSQIYTMFSCINSPLKYDNIEEILKFLGESRMKIYTK